MKKLSHYDKKGRVRMVDVTSKPASSRVAVAHAFVSMQRATVAAVRRLKSPKGSPLEIARIAGITAAKRTSELIPLCHPLSLTHVDYLGSDGHGTHGRRDGSAGGGLCGGAHDL
jgi:cyclic pyranopterin phosphate synthase